MRTSLLVGATLSVLLCGNLISAAPRLNLPEASFDFGYCPQNSQVTHTFWLHNTGDDTLVITNVIPGCGCTKAPLERDRLAVGDSTRLEIIFSTKRYTNRVTKRPRIATNEGTPDKNVTINADVMLRPDSTYPIVIRPYKLDVSQFGEKTRDEVTFSIENVSDRALKPTMVSWAGELMTVKLPKEIAPGKTEVATLKLTAEGVRQAFEKSFTIQLNDEQGSRFTVPTKRTVKDANSLTSIEQNAN